MSIYFISDLHLSEKTPHLAVLFQQFLEKITDADALYILGDLFDAWIGDDAIRPPVSTVIEWIATFSKRTPVYFLHGNRDFLIGERFATLAHCQLLPETTVIDLYGKPTLILHGDTLCTDDIAYQQFRLQARNPLFQKMFLSKTIEERYQIVLQIQNESASQMSGKTAEIMDVNTKSMLDTFKKYSVNNMIHGHTHRPAIEHFYFGENILQRIVLSDWCEQGNYLQVQPNGEKKLNYFKN